MSQPPFHLAFPVDDLAKARAFYGGLLGCPEGRSSEDWVDFDFYGHQIVAHLAPDEVGHRSTSAVDGDNVPVRHFGAVLSMTEWQALSDRLTQAGTKFIIEPHIRFKGQVGEQATMVFSGPLRQCAGVQGLRGYIPAFRQIRSLRCKVDRAGECS